MGNPETAPPVKAARLVSLDAYRGFIMLTMASAGLGFVAVNRYLDQAQLRTAGALFGLGELGPWFALPWLQADAPAPSRLFHFLAYQFDHVQWGGCSFWDLIQPSFIFMVGVAMPYSHAGRVQRGDSSLHVAGHVLLRALILVVLAIFLSSAWGKETNFIFTNVLAQIGLGYPLVYLLIGRGSRVQLGALVVILVGYWAWFAVYPLPPSDFDYGSVGIKPEWSEHLYDGFFAHWNKSTNAAHHFDVWFLNLFPRLTPYKFHSGGYATLNFVPSMATMIFGLMAGEMLRSDLTPTFKFRRLVLAGAVCLALGALLDLTVCPSVKRLWTPSWAVFSTGWTFWMLAGFFWVIDLHGWQRWAFPLVVVGMNSIAMYVMAQLLRPWVRDQLRIHLGQGVFGGSYSGSDWFPPYYAPIAEAVLVLSVLWVMCWWMYRQRIFIRI